MLFREKATQVSG